MVLSYSENSVIELCYKPTQKQKIKIAVLSILNVFEYTLFL